MTLGNPLFEIGQTVHLRSDARILMTIIKIEPSALFHGHFKTDVIWLNTKNEMQRATVPEYALVEYPKTIKSEQ